MPILICGSVAYDNIMVFDGCFRDHILPSSTHILNLSFLVPDLRREFGGCAANIAYNLRMLAKREEDTPLVMATVGEDADIFMQHLSELGLERTYITTVPETFTAQAFITTDQENNQITAFHPGAMGFSELNSVKTVNDTVLLGIVSPDGKTGMVRHAHEFSEEKIPFVLDLGQAMGMFNQAEVQELIDLASYITLNEYESHQLVEKIGMPIETIGQRVLAAIVTLGAKGSIIYTDNTHIDIPAIPAEAVVDPTGCGDAYRAGLLFGIANQMSWEDIGRLSSILGAIKVAHRGAQNHSFSREDIENIYTKHFGFSLFS